MKLWIDAQLSPALAPWINESIQGVDAVSLKWLDLRDAEDLDVFVAARKAGAVIMTKDCDFIELLARHGPPPKVIWLTCGNTSNMALRNILLTKLPMVLELLTDQEPLVEIR